MNTKDRLQIILPTYNRAPQLKRTLEQLLADDSPVKDFDITILDNRSTDGTSNVIKNAQSLHPNIKHIRHRHNVGGNANIAKALEMGEKKYLWVICDDDLYDWTGWSNVEELIDNGEKLICVCDFDLPQGHRDDPAYQLNQLAFLPSNIYSTSLLDDNALRNIFDMSVFLFPQLVPTVMLLNCGGRIAVAKRGIVQVGPREEGADYNSLVRGNDKNLVFQRSRTMSIPVGFANICANLSDRRLARRAFSICVNGPHVKRYGWVAFAKDIFLYQGGCKNAMHITDLKMQIPFCQRTLISVAYMLSCTPLRKLLLGSALHRAIQRLLARKNT